MAGNSANATLQKEKSSADGGGKEEPVVEQEWTDRQSLYKEGSSVVSVTPLIRVSTHHWDCVTLWLFRADS